MIEVTLTVERGDDDTPQNPYREIEVLCKFEYHAGCSGYRDSMGVPEEPDTPAELELIESTVNDVDFELTDEEQEEAEELAWRQCVKDVD